MMTLYTGNKSSMRFCWIEDSSNGKYAMVAINLSEVATRNISESFKAHGAPADLDWMDGIHSIRNGMNGISELAQHK